MSPYYLLTTEQKTWEPRFESLLDPLQWSIYEGLGYVPDVAMRKMWKGMRKKKRIHNEMDDNDKGYDNDMYDFDDFHRNKTKVHCLSW
jgi:hypothetical protein